MHIFISYRSTDRPLITQLAQDFEDLGYADVWFDQELTGGHAWWDAILQNIRTCDLFVFALTPASLESEPCRREYEYATQLNKRVLPVLLADGVNINLLPPQLQALQYVDYRQHDRKALSQLSRALVHLPDASPFPEPLPEAPSVPLSPLGELKALIDAGTIAGDTQASLILDLKFHLNDPSLQQDARRLLRQLRNHLDLRAPHASEIDAILKTPIATPQQQVLSQTQRQFPQTPSFATAFRVLITYAMIVGAWVVGGFITEELLLLRSYSKFRFMTLLLAYITAGGAGTSFVLIRAGKDLNSWRWCLVGFFAWPISLYLIVEFIDFWFNFQDFRRFYPGGYVELYYLTRNPLELPQAGLLVATSMTITSIILRHRKQLVTLWQQVTLVVGWVVIVIAVGLFMNTIPMENLLMPKEALLIGVIGGGFSLTLIKFANRNAT